MHFKHAFCRSAHNKTHCLSISIDAINATSPIYNSRFDCRTYIQLCASKIDLTASNHSQKF